MIITPPVLPPSYDVPTQVQLISDSEFKKRISNAVLCAEYSKDAYDAQDIFEKYNPVSNYNHTFTKNNNLLPVPSLINDKLNWSDFPSIKSNVAIQPYVW